ncbi:MAG: metalloregulator ArsR/SmtB family transcription factor [Crocinitomicaceae bacterium]
MGLTKKDLFSTDQNEMAEVAKVLGHPARIAILEHLLTANECVNGQLVQELGLAQATISQHLKELKKIKLIKGTIEGTSMCYCIDADKWTQLKSLFNQLFDRHPCCSGKNC